MGRDAEEERDSPGLREVARVEYDWSRLGESAAEVVVTVIGDHYGLYGRVIPRDTDLFRDLGSDVVDVLELLMTLEECFGVYFDDEQRARVRTVGDAVDMLEAAVSRKGGQRRDSQGKRKGPQA